MELQNLLLLEKNLLGEINVTLILGDNFFYGINYEKN